MCLILIALHQHSRYPLVVAANRDEFFERPAAAAEFWPDAPQLLAGRDLQAGGTWLGATRNGRFAAVTNVREPDQTRPDARSRGELTSGFLLGHASAEDYLSELQPVGNQFNGFNLICGTVHQLFHYSNRSPAPIALTSGVHGVSNRVLDTPWPKVTGGKAELTTLLQQSTFNLDEVIPILNQRNPAADETLPDTGVGLVMERMLSSRFIHAPLTGYGTRVSTVLRVDITGQVEWKEWSWNSAGECESVRDHRFPLSVH